ncbi:MAG: PGN_0703 family putative restriction endonuclease [Anaerolineae bacterium]
MSYKTMQYKVQASFFQGKCGGKFGRLNHDFILSDQFRYLNLYPSIYSDALAYFNRNSIRWWRGDGDIVTNHTLSSQVACVNHLFWLMHNESAATAVLQVIDKDYTAIPFDTGNYVEFEYNGCEQNQGVNLLGEKGTIRGTQSTSLDACMLAEFKGQRVIICIEWKYVETYHEKVEQAVTKPNYRVRKSTYRKLLTDPDSPIHVIPADFDNFYSRYSVEPYYQLMRQTLWGWLFSQKSLLGTSDYRHIHVIPYENTDLLHCKTSPQITRDNLISGWRGCLREPEKYVHLSPRQFVEPAVRNFSPNLYCYLLSRYWKNAG